MPKSEGAALDAILNSSNIRTLLSTYDYVSPVLNNLEDSRPVSKIPTHCFVRTMAAIFDRFNPASPLAYGASQTALLLLDFQGFCIDRCGTPGLAALVRK